jgi:hypothetical protein
MHPRRGLLPGVVLSRQPPVPDARHASTSRNTPHSPTPRSLTSARNPWPHHKSIRTTMPVSNSLLYVNARPRRDGLGYPCSRTPPHPGREQRASHADQERVSHSWTQPHPARRSVRGRQRLAANGYPSRRWLHHAGSDAFEHGAHRATPTHERFSPQPGRRSTLTNSRTPIQPCGLSEARCSREA